MQFDACIGLNLPEGVGGTMNINNRDIMLNIGTYARATKCACAYGSVQDPPTSIYPRSLASYESMLEATVYAVLKSTRVQLSMIRCSAANRFFFTTAEVPPRNRDKQGDGRDKAVKIGTVPLKSGQLRPMTHTCYSLFSSLFH